ncbi:transporter protein Sec61 subunit alpha [Ceratobasidium sp. AG-Ba]|nr:transporter protein Sec61 subunit alpha [Ceratobasidium sp. AG-Ba]
MVNKPHRCKRCPRRFKTHSQLVQHREHEHNQPPQETNRSSESPEHIPVNDPGQCPYCDHIFDGQQGLIQHLGHPNACRDKHRLSINADTSSISSVDVNDPDVNNPPLEDQAQVNSPEYIPDDDLDALHGVGGARDLTHSEESDHNFGNDDDASSLSEGDLTESDSEAEDGIGSGSNSDEDSSKSDETIMSKHEGDIDIGLPEGYENPRTPSEGTVDDPIEHQAHVELEEIVDQYGIRTYIEKYPSATAGEPVGQVVVGENQPYPDVGELADCDSFEIAKLLMESGVSGRFRNCYLRLKRIKALMPWKNNRALIKDVDKLPHGPDWAVSALRINGATGAEVVESWTRSPLDVLKQMVKSKQIGPKIQLKPVKKYVTPDRTERIRDEGWTADRMWDLQEEIGQKDPNATVLCCVVSSDETKLTTFSGNKKAHPVYMTLTNLPKHYRRKISKRANVLIGYLPVPKLDCIPDKEERRKTRRNLFHHCLGALLEPLAKGCETGVEMEFHDGGIRCVYPVLTAYVADFPEQCKVAWGAPVCKRDDVLDALEKDMTTGSALFNRLGLFQTMPAAAPFWKNHQYTDIGCLLTPDLLHQLHKGVLKDHLTKWATHIVGKRIIDKRHTTMPEFHGMRHFKNGILSVSQWTGRELKEMAKVLLPIIATEDNEVVTAARALLDFVYLAHASSLKDTELAAMEIALRTFHKFKIIFRQYGAISTKKGFHGIPKIHMILHYVYIIRQLGTPDGYNTETSERLHIDFAKLGYRASNKVNATKQMALYIQRLEALAMHQLYLEEQAERLQQEQNIWEIHQYQQQVAPATWEMIDEDEEEWDEWYDKEEADEDAEEEGDIAFGVVRDVDVDDILAGLGDVVGEGGLASRDGGSWEQEQPRADDPLDQHPCFHPVPECHLAKTPTTRGVEISEITTMNLAHGLANDPTLFLRREHPEQARSIRVSERVKLNVWSCAQLFHAPAPFKPSEGSHINVVRAQPAKIDCFERIRRPPQFDTVLILRDKGKSGIHRYQAARTCVIFTLPAALRNLYSEPLVYVELFYPMSNHPQPGTGLFTVTRALKSGTNLPPVYSTLDIDNNLGPITSHSDLLQLCRTFYFNIFATYALYELLRHWGQDGSP